mgnify:CR=1 FL=1
MKYNIVKDLSERGFNINTVIQVIEITEAEDTLQIEVGKVYLFKWKQSGKYFLEEVRFYRKNLQHDLLCKCYGVEDTKILGNRKIDKLVWRTGSEAGLFLLLEYIPGKTLYDVYTDEKFRNTPECIPKIKKYISQICDALIFLQENRFMYIDLKGENIMICQETDNIKLIDFEGCYHEDDDIPQIVIGAHMFMTPEQMVSYNNVSYFTASWQLGVLLYEIVTKVNPFDTDKTYSQDNIKKRIMNIEYDKKVIKDSPFKKLIKSLLVLKPENRLTYSQIKEYIENMP